LRPASEITFHPITKRCFKYWCYFFSSVQHWWFPSISPHQTKNQKKKCSTSFAPPTLFVSSVKSLRPDLNTRNHFNKSSRSVIHIDKMVKEDALLLLLGPEICGKPSLHAVKIIEELDCMLLAVDMVRAYIDRTGTLFKTYLEIYSKKRAFLFKNEQDKGRNLYVHNVATMWDLSFKKLHEQSSIAGLIIGACAFLHPDAIPE
jgi:hypothetical protein